MSETRQTKIEHHLDSERLAVFFLEISRAFAGEGEDGLAAFGLTLGDVAKLKLTAKKQDEGFLVKIKVKEAGVEACKEACHDRNK